MGILSRAFEKRFHPSQPADWFLKLASMSTAAGVDVTVESSLQSVAVFACVRILAETVASLPLVLYRRLARGKERATDHSLYSLLHDLPNPEMTSVELRETLMGHLALWGNAYAEIEYDNAGRVRGLWPLRADKVTPKRQGGRLVYVVEMPIGPDETLPSDRVMHIRGLGYDGMVGYSPIGLARQAVGLALATEEFGARFFGNGARPGMVLEHPGKLSDEAYDRLKESWEMRHQGLSQAHRIAILEEGMKAEAIGIPPEDAQFLQTRKFQVTEIARLFRVPPHMLADLERATFSNIEHQSLEFVIHTIRPWLVRWEQAIHRDLLSENERQTYFAEHLVAGLLRGDVASRYQAYATARQNGWMSANDIRELENMNPVDGGDVYLVPLNMVPADQVNEGYSAPADGTRTLDDAEKRSRNLAKSRRRLAASWRRVMVDTTERVIRREVNDVRRAVRKYFGKRDAHQFSLWLAEFYEDHKAFWIRQFLPILLAYADQVGVSVADELGGDPRDNEDIQAFIDQYAEALATRQAGESRLQLQSLLDQALQEGEADPVDVIEERLGEWEEKRPAKIAEHESRNALHAMMLAFYVLAGVTRYRWVASGENCPYCRELDGKIIGIEQTFVAKGEELEPDGAERPLKKRHDVRHPPLHGGCDCTIRAERK